MAEAAAGERRSSARCSAGRSSSSTTIPSATPRPRRRCAAPPPSAGFREVEFQYEPIAAAFDHEQGVAREEKVLVADIGGGTSDFSLVRVGPERMARLRSQGRHPRQPRRPHRRHRLRSPGRARDHPAAVRLRRLRPRARRRAGARGAERRLLRPRHLAPDQHRLQPAARRRAARHALVLRRPGAASAADDGRGRAPRPRPRRPRRGREDRASPPAARRRSRSITSSPASRVALAEADALRALDADLDRIVAAARATVAQAGLAADAVDALYLTGGSTGLDILSQRLHRAFAGARLVRGDRFASVATGLALFAQRRFAGRRRR